MFVSLLLEDKIKTAVKEATKEVETRYKGRSYIPGGILEQSIIKNYDRINFFQDHEIDPCVVELHDIEFEHITLSEFEPEPKPNPNPLLNPIDRYKYIIGVTMAGLGYPSTPTFHS